MSKLYVELTIASDEDEIIGEPSKYGLCIPGKSTFPLLPSVVSIKAILGQYEMVSVDPELTPRVLLIPIPPGGRRTLVLTDHKTGKSLVCDISAQSYEKMLQSIQLGEDCGITSMKGGGE